MASRSWLRVKYSLVVSPTVFEKAYLPPTPAGASAASRTRTPAQAIPARRLVIPMLFIHAVHGPGPQSRSGGRPRRVPGLRVVLLESEYSWLWRIDKVWKEMNDDYPWVERPPSEYVRDHVWLASHPIAEAGNPGHVKRTLEMVRAEETLLFGSQFPSFDDGALEADLSALDPSLARAISPGAR